MELKKLEYLEALYRLRNFTQAAEEQFISQPAITNAIRKLEEELDCTLIDRSAKPLAFTQDGERFMKHVYNILNAVEDAKYDMQMSRKGQTRQFRFGLSHTLGDWMRNRIQYDFCNGCFDMPLEIIDATNQEMMEQLFNRELDLLYTLIPDSLDSKNFCTIPMQNCSLNVLMSVNHPLAARDVVSLNDLRQEKIFTYPEGSLIRFKLETVFRQLRIVPNLHTITPVYIMRHLTEDNVGITFIVNDTPGVYMHTDKLIEKPLDKPIYYSRGFVYNSNHPITKPMCNMITYMERIIAEHQKEAQV